jgi:TRAP transporter TAXI family solute receptor
MKKFFKFVLVLSMISVVFAGCGSDTKSTAKTTQQTFINIATGGTAGTYYPLGGALADILNKNIEGVNASAQSTGASVANINLLKQGKVDIAFVQNDIAYYASNGKEMFTDKKVPGLKGIATLYPETIQIVTLADSGIKTVADMKGKKIAVGAAGSGTEANSRQILEANGLTYDDVDVQYLSFGEAASALKDGNVDAGFVTAGFPTAAIQDISTQHDIVLVEVPVDTADKLIAKYPYYTKVVIPAKTYNNQENDVKAVAVKCMLVASDKMSEKLGYDVTKALFTNLDRMKAAHASAKFISKETAEDGMPIPLNAGSKKYLESK